jgi:NADH:ubiquinone oxidoreductase subunit 3 (subunit A)
MPPLQTSFNPIAAILFFLNYLFSRLGDFEVFFNYLSVIILGFIIYNVINCFSFRDLIKRFGFLKIARRDFYECGFRPQTQKPIKLPIQFLLICVFFLLYDIELVFLFPYVSGVIFAGLYDFLLLILFFVLFLLSLIIDYERHALY